MGLRVTIATVCLLASACASVVHPVEARVDQVDRLPPEIEGLKVVFPAARLIPADEFHDAYITSVSLKLQSAGFSITEDSSEANYEATIHYRVGEARRVSEYRPDFTSDGFAVWRPTTRTYVDSELILNLSEIRPLEDRAPGVAYLSKVSTTGAPRPFVAISECMIEAVFEQFRGNGLRFYSDTECLRAAPDKINAASSH